MSDPEPKAIVICVRESDISLGAQDLALIQDYVNCASCGERCVISAETVELLKDPAIKPQCDVCTGPKMALDILAGEGAYLAPGTWDEVRKVVSDEDYHRMRLFAVTHNIQEATMEEMENIEREKEIRKEFGT